LNASTGSVPSAGSGEGRRGGTFGAVVDASVAVSVTVTVSVRVDASSENGLRLGDAGDVLAALVEEIGLDDDRPAAAVERPRARLDSPRADG
jgi:hypothetical protein